MTNLEIVETQNTIIKLQAEVIYDLYTQLLQHITCAEAENISVTQKINICAKLRNEINRN